MQKYFLLLLFFTLCLNKTTAQSDSSSVIVFSSNVDEVLAQKQWEDLNAVSASIATKSEMAIEKIPSVISVISAKDIQRWGCRDLSDVLRLVQGFEFGIDVQSLFGLGFRGIWAHEGKVLMMINGTSINCFGFGNGNFFGTITAAMIEKVEIIRGPGSALYGGFAEIAVINVITKSDDVIASTSVGFIGKELTYSGNIGFSIKKASDIKLNVNIGASFSPLSKRIYQDFFNNSLQMGSESSWKRWQHIIVDGQYKKFKFSYNRNLTNFMGQDAYDTILAKNQNGVYANELYNFIQTVQLKYDINFTPKLKLQPFIELSQGNPSDNSTTFNVFGAKYTSELNLSYKNKNDEWIIGLGYQINTIRSITNGRMGIQSSINIEDSTAFLQKDAQYAFFQYIKSFQYFSIIAGTRYEITPFGNAFAPRLGITFQKNAFYAKLLYGRAFRTPTIWQAFSKEFLVSEIGLKPETSNTIEFELGYKFSDKFKTSINAFWIDISNPITYIGTNNSYQNYGRVGSMGLEGEINYRANSYGSFLNFSVLRPLSSSTIDFVTSNKSAFLAMPNIKFNWGFYFNYKKISLSPSITYLGERYGQSQFSAINSTIDDVIFENQTYPALVLANFCVSFDKIFKKLDLQLKVNNLFDAKYLVIQPYYGGHAPMPVNDRQFTLTTSYKF